MTRARQPRGDAPEVQPADATRLVLVPHDATAREVLYERVAPVINRMVWLYLATDRERDDIAQDIFVAILKSASSLRDPERLEAWASSVAFNTICNVFRRRRLVRWLSLEALAGYEPPDRHTDFEGRELLVRAQKILEHLPVAERMPFTMQLLGDASHREIARLCACSERTVRRRIKAGRERFLSLVKRDPLLASRLAERLSAVEEPSDG